MTHRPLSDKRPADATMTLCRGRNAVVNAKPRTEEITMRKLSPRLRGPILVLAGCAVLVYGIVTMACSEPAMTHTRSSDDPSIDEPAMSTGLDKKDLDLLYSRNVQELMASRFMAGVSGQQRQIAIMPFINETTEHIGPQLASLLSDLETTLVNDGRLVVVSAERRDEILDELRQQQGVEFDLARASVIGRQLGANYVLTGKVFDSAERTDDMRRTQYFFYLQVIDVETGAIAFQFKTDHSKALVPIDS